MFETVVRPAMISGAETWATTKKRLYVNEMRMLRWMDVWDDRDKIKKNSTCTREKQPEWRIYQAVTDKWFGGVRT